MDDRFDKALFTIAAGSFGVSFAFINSIVSLATAAHLPVLAASWTCFALCLIVMVLGHLVSAEAFRKQCDNIVKNVTLQFEGKPAENKAVRDIVSPCNYASLILYAGGIVCLLLFIFLNATKGVM
jgi:hypothetical protein